MGWLLRERATGREWRVGDSDLAWELGGFDSGFDTARFELHVLAEDVAGLPDGRPDGIPAAEPSRLRASGGPG